MPLRRRARPLSPSQLPLRPAQASNPCSASTACLQVEGRARGLRRHGWPPNHKLVQFPHHSGGEHAAGGVGARGRQVSLRWVPKVAQAPRPALVGTVWSPQRLLCSNPGRYVSSHHASTRATAHEYPRAPPPLLTLGSCSAAARERATTHRLANSSEPATPHRLANSPEPASTHRLASGEPSKART